MSSEESSKSSSNNGQDDYKVYHLAIRMYRRASLTESGQYHFQGLVRTYNQAISLSPRSTWADYKRQRWSKVKANYPAIVEGHVEEDFGFGFGLEYSKHGSQQVEQVRISAAPEDNFFGLLARGDIVVVKMYLDFAPESEKEKRGEESKDEKKLEDQDKAGLDEKKQQGQDKAMHDEKKGEQKVEVLEVIAGRKKKVHGCTVQ